MNRRSLLAAGVALPVSTALAFADIGNMNFSGRQAYIINNCPQIELSGFSYENVFIRSAYRLQTNISWRNVSQQPIMSFEIIILYFDPFNRRIPGGGAWLVTGKNSGDWSVLQPGQSQGDGLTDFEAKAVLTAFAYVRAVRQANGDVWYFQPASVEKDVRRLLPNIRDIGTLDPQLEKPPTQ